MKKDILNVSDNEFVNILLFGSGKYENIKFFNRTYFYVRKKFSVKYFWDYTNTVAQLYIYTLIKQLLILIEI